jgi:hypothetical protein
MQTIEEEDDVDNQAVYGRPFPKTGRVLHDSTKLARKKKAIEECLQEMCHDGVNVFRVVVYEKHDDAQKIFPVQSKHSDGTVHGLRYCLKAGVPYEIWLSLLSKGDIKVHAHYTAYEKAEVYEGEYSIRQSFLGQQIGCLQLDEDPDEVDVYEIDTVRSHERKTIMTMTFGTRPISVAATVIDNSSRPSGLDEIVQPVEAMRVAEIVKSVKSFDEIVEQFQAVKRGCVTVDLRITEYLFKCFLVPVINSQVEGFRQTAWQEDGCPVIELSTSTVNQVQVFILCPMECAVSLRDKQGHVTSTCQAPANTCTLVGSTRAMVSNAWDLKHNAFQVSILQSTFPFYVALGTPSTLGGGLTRGAEHEDGGPMDTQADIQVLLDQLKQI